MSGQNGPDALGEPGSEVTGIGIEEGGLSGHGFDLNDSLPPITLYIVHNEMERKCCLFKYVQKRRS